ncbi:uncharacterized protein [Dendrobates tinctorius]|uniref:uncharacterized protein n=1 Tax=Dendrobates tinctorius TaxID=92724 RepID=UPI003CC9B0AF
MSFTRDQEVPRRMVAMLAEENEIQSESPVGDVPDDALSTTSASKDIDCTPIVMEEDNNEPTPSALPRRLHSSAHKRKALTSDTLEFIQIAKKVLTMQQAQPVITGIAHYVNEKITALEETQRVHAERIILDTLSKAATGKLSDTSAFVDRQPTPLYSLAHTQEPLESAMRRGIDSEPNQNLGHLQNFYFTPSRQRFNDSDPYYQQL